jgi:hypothetical protein
VDNGGNEVGNEGEGEGLANKEELRGICPHSYHEEDLRAYFSRHFIAKHIWGNGNDEEHQLH